MRDVGSRFADSPPSSDSAFASSRGLAAFAGTRAPSHRPRVLAFAAVAFLALLALTSTARAEYGVVGYYQFSGEIGGSNSMVSATINHAGAGGADPGDFYVASPLQQFSVGGDLIGNLGLSSREDVDVNQSTGEVAALSLFNSVDVFSATGELIRTFGLDVVLSGPGDSSVDEQQQLTVTATGGTYTLSSFFTGFGTLTTAPIPYDASAEVVETAINELAGINNEGGHVTVTGGPGDSVGSNPYLLTFDGIFSGDDNRQFSSSASGLFGNPKSAAVETLVEGGAPEICTPADVCKGAASGNTRVEGGTILGGQSMAIAPQGAPNAGNVIVATDTRIDEFTSAGEFVRTSGWDVVSSGTGDSGLDEEQAVTVKGTGGKYSLAFRGETTGAAGTGNRESGSATISNLITNSGSFEAGERISGTGIPAGTTIEAVGATTLTLSAPATSNGTATSLTGNDIDFDAEPAAVKAALETLPTIGGAGGEVTVTGGPGDLTGSSPYQIVFGGTLGGDNLEALTSNTAGLTISSGSKSVAVQAIVTGGEYETCVAAEGDICSGGEVGVKLGQSRGTVSGIVQDSNGNRYIAEDGQSGFKSRGNYRAQKFTPSGPSFTPGLFGSVEQQTFKVSAGAGDFRLSLGAETGGTTGTGDVTAGSDLITNVFTTKGEFVVGQPIRDTGISGFAIPADAVIKAVSPGTITLSKPATGNETTSSLVSNAPYTTADLPFNASAAEVEAEFNELPSGGQRRCGSPTTLGYVKGFKSPSGGIP